VTKTSKAVGTTESPSWPERIVPESVRGGDSSAEENRFVNVPRPENELHKQQDECRSFQKGYR